MSRAKLGYIGEEIVAHVLREKGISVSFSDDIYDDKKDLVVRGKTAEVKTIQLYRLRNLCSIRTHQLQKCSDVNYLFFLLTPDNYGRNYAEIVMYPKCCRNWIRYQTTYRDMYGLKYHAGVSIEKIYDEELLDNLRELTYSQHE